MMNGKQPSISHMLSEESLLTHEGFIRFNGFPVAFVKSNLSVLLLLPFEELSRRPYYSATFNGFIELHYSISRLCPRFTLALVAEWASRYFGLSTDPKRSDYVKKALQRLYGWHHGKSDLASALSNPDDPTHDYPLADKLSAAEADVLDSFQKSLYPIYIVSGLWSNHIRSPKTSYLPTREARRLVPIDNGYVPVITNTDLLVKVKVDDQHRENLMGLCVRKIESDGEIKKVWFLPKRLWKWFMYEPEQKQFLTAKEMEKLLPATSSSNLCTGMLDDTLNTLAWSQDPELTNKELEDVCMLLLEIDHPDEKPLVVNSPLFQLFLENKDLAEVLQAIESSTQGKHSAFEVDPVVFAAACALKAMEFQGESSEAGIQYCPMPDVNALKTFYQRD